MKVKRRGYVRQLVLSAAERQLAKTAEKCLLKTAARKSTQRIACKVFTGTSVANPVFIAADIGEVLVEKATGDKQLAKATSFVGYLATGLAMGGPFGAAGALFLWGLGQMIAK